MFLNWEWMGLNNGLCWPREVKFSGQGSKGSCCCIPWHFWGSHIQDDACHACSRQFKPQMKPGSWHPCSSDCNWHFQRSTCKALISEQRRWPGVSRNEHSTPELISPDKVINAGIHMENRASWIIYQRNRCSEPRYPSCAFEEWEIWCVVLMASLEAKELMGSASRVICGTPVSVCLPLADKLSKTVVNQDN